MCLPISFPSSFIYIFKMQNDFSIINLVPNHFVGTFNGIKKYTEMSFYIFIKQKKTISMILSILANHNSYHNFAIEFKKTNKLTKLMNRTKKKIGDEKKMPKQ